MIADAQDLHHRHPQLWARVTYYLVDHTGTRRIPGTPRSAQLSDYPDAA